MRLSCVVKSPKFKVKSLDVRMRVIGFSNFILLTLNFLIYADC
jgi:hypothetical protein